MLIAKENNVTNIKESFFSVCLSLYNNFLMQSIRKAAEEINIKCIIKQNILYNLPP